MTYFKGAPIAAKSGTTDTVDEEAGKKIINACVHSHSRISEQRAVESKMEKKIIIIYNNTNRLLL